MPTIIAVHGTFAGGPSNGEKWWQRGGAFDRDVQSYLRASDGPVTFIPVSWDGTNSETSRRAAARVLTERMLELERDNQTYSVIGHSHGGTIICLSLLEAVKRREPLAGLKAWITVGTPFINLRKAQLLFFRVSYLGKSTILTMTTFLALILLAFLSDTLSGGLTLLHLLLLVAPFAAIYAAMLQANRRKFHIYRRRNWSVFERDFAPRWVALNHPDDEAIQGLAVVGSNQLDVFNRRFAVAPLTFIGAVFPPLLLFATVLSPTLMAHAESWIGITRANRFGEDPNVLVNIRYFGLLLINAAEYFANWVHPRLEFAFSLFSDGGQREVMEAGVSFVNLLIVPVFAILLLGYGVLGMIGTIALAVSFVLSKLLNRVARSQIRATALGDDLVGEVALGVRPEPFGLTRAFSGTLPKELADEITKISDEEAIRALPRLRGALRELAATESGATQKDMIAKYLSGSELIHSSYFRAPRFRRFLTHLISLDLGLVETPAAMSNSEHADMLKCFDEFLRGRQCLPKLSQ